MEGKSGTLVVFVVDNRGAVVGILTKTGTGTGPATTDLIFRLALLKLPSGFFSHQ